MKEKGFTLLEMSIGLGIIFTISAISVAPIQGAITAYRLGVTAEAISTTLYRARSEAIKRNTNFNVLFSQAANSYGIDANGNGVLDASEATALPPGTSLALPSGAVEPAAIRFTSRGEMPITATAPVLANPPSVQVSAYGHTEQISVSLRGSVSITSVGG